MSSATTRRPLAEAQAVADEILTQLTPHCEKISLAGSIRRQSPTIGDVEIVCLPLPYEPAPLLRSGIALVVEQWAKVRGELPCKYSKRLLPCGMKLDLFMPDPRGYGLQLAIRTGSADWCRTVLAPAWVRAHYRSEGGLLRDPAGRIIPTPDERELFRRIGLPWVEPVDREVSS